MAKTSIKTKIKLSALGIATALIVFAVVYWREPIYAIVTSEQARNEFIELVRERGIVGVAVFFGLQVLQVVVAVIPGEPVEIMAGMLYGTVFGMGICLAGVLTGSLIIYSVLKLLGANTLDSEKFAKYKFLNHPHRLEVILFLLFLIPGTPKDMLIYVAPFMPMRAKNFFLISTFARIPSVISSTFLGANLATGNFGITIVVFSLTAVAGLLGIIYNDKLITYLSKNKQKAVKTIYKS